ncbi:MAG: hypothetical protein ABGX23_07150 [Nautiliaceae bacterium]
MKIVISLLLAISFGFAQSNLTSKNLTDKNLTEINSTKEINSTLEENITIEEFNDIFKSIQPTLNFAIMIDKKKLYKFVPSIINSITTYFLSKGVEFSYEVFDINDDLTLITNKYQTIFYITTDKNSLQNLTTYSANFYIPTFNLNELDIFSPNLFFGGIDFKLQVRTLYKYLADPKAAAITDKNLFLSNQLLKIEQNDLNISITNYYYPNIPYWKLNNKYLFLNTSTPHTTKILGDITYHNINTKLQFSTQINYSPLMINLTQPDDVRKLLIANSIINIPSDLRAYNELLNSDIKYNWLNYSLNTLANKAYKLSQGDEDSLLDDFNLYMFNNQVIYKAKLYQIINRGFKSIE